MEYKFTRQERRWGFRFESLGLSYVLHLGVDLKAKSIRFLIFGFGFNAGRIIQEVETKSGDVAGGEYLEQTLGKPISLSIDISKHT